MHNVYVHIMSKPQYTDEIKKMEINDGNILFIV